MDVQVMGGNFNYLIVSRIYYTRVLVFSITFCIIADVVRSSALAQANRTQFCVHTGLIYNSIKVFVNIRCFKK